MKKNPEIIVVAGGIGCGKSVVCKMLASMGFAVYDCDSRAKAIMDESCDIIDGIASEICREAIVENGGRGNDLASVVVTQQTEISKVPVLVVN